MWIGRLEWDHKVMEAAKVPLLEREIEYWRTQYEKERSRADRLTDTVLQGSGVPPVSDESLVRAESADQKRKNMMNSIKEVFIDNIGDMQLNDAEKTALSEMENEAK